ncbi:kelch-like protein 25 [Caerostris darwini]|uniref:Kelch-like protein diablo n=1 Tax=Caerostris darwini TaxID=1538125 RepID=A0AAV4TTQ2_9ARAC|nr:kelch-like protein 25 [Caerostris darwini]
MSVMFAGLFEAGEFERLQKLSDARLHTEDGAVFEVHRMFLAYRSPFFLSLFCRNEQEHNFYIPNVSGTTLDIVLVFLYTGQVSVTEENVKDLLLASRFLLVEDLSQICRQFAVGKMSPNNCIRLFVAAWHAKEHGLLEDCYRFVQIHFEEILFVSGDGVGDLPLDAFLRFLGDKNLNVSSERVPWKAILKWTEAETPDRLCFVPQLLSNLLWVEVDEDLATEILAHPIVKCNFFCAELNTKALSGSNRDVLRDYIQKTQPLTSGSRTRLPSSLYFITYYSISKGIPLIKFYVTYDDHLDVWREVGNIDFWPDSLIPMRERIYMFSSLENRSLAFDALNGSLVSIRPSPFPRFHYHAVALNGSIYAVGGATERDESTCLVERYEPGSDTWELMKPMVPMVLWAVTVIGSRIYAIGEDRTTSDPSMQVQVYDSLSASWSTVSSPKIFRQEFAVVVFGDRLHLIGGHSILECLRSVEQYDPASDTWTSLPDLPFTYILPKAVILDNKVVVFEDLFKGKRYGTVYPPVHLDCQRESWVVMTPESPLTDVHLYQFCQMRDPQLLKELSARNRCPGTRWTRSSLGKSFT